MKTIYIDSLFLLNLLIDYLLCLLSARVCGVVLRRRRYALAALLGAAYAVAVWLPGLAFLNSALMKLLLWLTMSLCAFGNEERIFRCALVFAAVSAAFGGFLWAIQLSGGYPVFDMRTLILAFTLCCVLFRLVFSGKARLAEKPRVCVTLTWNDRQAKLLALVDTGNHLRDPHSGRPVLIASPHALIPLFPGEEALLQLDAVCLLEQADRSPTLRGKFRLIPCSTVSGSTLLCAFHPDAAYVDGKSLDLMVAVSPQATGDGFQAIL